MYSYKEQVEKKISTKNVIVDCLNAMNKLDKKSSVWTLCCTDGSKLERGTGIGVCGHRSI